MNSAPGDANKDDGQSQNGAARHLPFEFSDLLLVLIAALASSRFMAQTVVWLLASGVTLAPEQRLAVTLVLLLLQSLILIAVIRWFVLRRHHMSWAKFGLAPPHGKWFLQSVFLGLACTPMVALLNLVLQVFTDGPTANPQLQALAPAGFSWPAAIAVTVVASSIVPFAEELAFRGLAFRWLRDRLGTLAGALLSALVFAALHGIPQLIPAITLLGLVLAWTVQRSGSLWPAIVVHGVFNATMTTLLYVALAAGVPLP